MKVICYGDSNTYGYDPRDPLGGRYDIPWPQWLANETGWTVINKGENGREIPGKAVAFPEDADLIILMLGTNDLLQFWPPEKVSDKMEQFLAGISQPVLLIAPPTMVYGAWVQDRELIDDSITLAECYRSLAQRLGIGFADAGSWNIPLAHDGVHLTEEGHRIFAKALLQHLIKGD